MPGSPQSGQPVQFFGLLPPLPQSSLNNQGDTPRQCPVFSRRLPRRLNFAYFWARTRIVQKACMVRQTGFTILSAKQAAQVRLWENHGFCFFKSFNTFLFVRVAIVLSVPAIIATKTDELALWSVKPFKIRKLILLNENGDHTHL